MVRMENPSPIQVGREFVRQYYTLLNKAPDMLHRFYGVHSSYVHGSRYCDGESEEGVIGQMAIHKKITSLQFKECHTKVRQVDAHSTIGSGVVVQVIGELSNDRKPLRRFMQTFVLAPQGDNPYKFYVHNDIFRYEDEVFQEEVAQERLDEEQESEEEDSLQQLPPSGQYDNHSGYYQTQAPIISNGIEQRLDPALSAAADIIPTSTSPITSLPDSPSSGTQQTHENAQELPQTHSPDPEPEESTESPIYSPSSGADEDRSQNHDTAANDPPEITGTPPTTSEAEPSSITYSWAALASKNTPMQYNTQQGTVVKVNQSAPLGQQQTQGESAGYESQPQRTQNRNARGSVRTGYREDNDRGSGDRGAEGMRRTIRYPDNQQIFVGNLPYEITETDLRDHFAEFGDIVEVRINHSHTSNPSFGFIIFEDPKSVEEVLQQMPTTFKNNKRINIEEKKQRSTTRDVRRGGPSGMDVRRDNMRGGGMGGNRMQQRGGARRDRGGSRDGQRPGGNFAPRR